MTMQIDGTNGWTFPDGSVQKTAPNNMGFKNRIINGAMMIDQRNAGASVTPSGGAYLLDRWVAGLSQSSKYSVQQNAGSVTPPVGFVNYLGVTSLSAYSVGSSDYFAVSQRIEGLNVSDLGWGTANAASVTVSFWIRSSLTGTFGGSVANNDSNRSYPFSYIVNSANTWEQKTVTIAGDTTGTWLTTNGRGLVLNFSLGMGSTYSGTSGSWAATNYLSTTGAVSVVGTNGATFYITGVQLEKGSTATSFDYRPYGTELALCQRYLPAFTGSGNWFGTGSGNTSTQGYCTAQFPVQTRVAPTGVTVSSVSHFNVTDYTVIASTATAIAFSAAGTSAALLSISVASGVTVNRPLNLNANSASANLYFTGCEL